jgi:hypothetical protein
MPTYTAKCKCTAGQPPRYLEEGESIFLPEDAYVSRHLEPLEDEPVVTEPVKRPRVSSEDKARLKERREQARVANIPDYVKLTLPELEGAVAAHLAKVKGEQDKAQAGQAGLDTALVPE